MHHHRLRDGAAHHRPAGRTTRRATTSACPELGTGAWWVVVISCMLTLSLTGYCLSVEVSRVRFPSRRLFRPPSSNTTQHIRIHGWPKVIGGRDNGSEDGEERRCKLD